jgi:hypothetical protein
MGKTDRKSSIALVLAVIGALFLAACSPGPDDDRANARGGFNDPDMFGDDEDDGLDTGSDTRSNARGAGNNTTPSGMYADKTTTGDTRADARGTTSSQYTGSEGTMDTRSNARGDTTVNVYDDADSFGEGDSNIYEDGTRANARADTTIDGQSTTVTTGTRANVRMDERDADMIIMRELDLGDGWTLIDSETLETEPQETTIYVYANNDVDTRSNARTTDNGDGTTSIMFVDTETRSSYRGETVTTVDSEAALMYVVVRGGAVAGAVMADEAMEFQTVNSRLNARDTTDDEDDLDNDGFSLNNVDSNDDDEDEDDEDDEEDENDDNNGFSLNDIE